MPEMRFAMIAVVFLAIFGPLGIAHAGPIRVGELTCASSSKSGIDYCIAADTTMCISVENSSTALGLLRFDTWT